MAVGFGAGALLALTPLGLGGALFTTGVLTWAMDKRQGIATFVDDPRAATREYLTTTPPSQMAADALGALLTFVPGGVGAGTGGALRPALRDAVWALRRHPGEFLDSAAARIRWEARHGDDLGAVTVVSARSPGDPAALGWATTKDYRATFARANPDVDMSTVVVHHAVERNALTRFPGLFDEYELHSIENLRGIPKTINSEVHLRAIRKEWDAFAGRIGDGRLRPTRGDVLEEATRIDEMFGHLFTPRER